MNRESSEFASAVTPRQGGGKRTAFLAITALLGAGGVIPAVVNFALAGRLSWSLYSLGAVAMAWLILAPWFVFPRNRAPLSWGAAVVTVPLFLWLVETLAPAKGWLLPLGLPAAALGLAALGGLVAVWRSGWVKAGYAAALTFSILGILTFAEYLVARPYTVWEVPGPVIGIISLCVGGASVALFLIAFVAHRRRAP
jgi:hypothetical protein